jgi:Domain of unknown function (DUF4386)
MSSTHNPGRVAGWLYLLLGFSAFRPIYIGGTLIVRADATGTARNIATHELLFRLGIVSDLLAGIGCILVALALYQLLKGVDEKLAVLMVILGGLMPCVIDFLNVLNDVAALLLARGEPFLSAFGKQQQAELAMLFLHIHDHGWGINEIFAGLWLFPFGVLVFRSVFLPRVLGIGLIINGFAYLVTSFTGLLAPQYLDRVTRIASPALLGEAAIIVWLLIKGARPLPLGATASKLAAA